LFRLRAQRNALFICFFRNFYLKTAPHFSEIAPEHFLFRLRAQRNALFICFFRNFYLKAGLRRQICAFVLGGLTALAQAPFHLFFICFFTFPLLIMLLDGINQNQALSRRRQLGVATLTGWSFGFGYFVSGLWWLGYLMLTEGSAFGMMMVPLAMLGLPALMAVYWGLAVFIQTLLSCRGYARLLALAFGFGLAEWLRGVLFTGFPWNAIGYSAMPSPLWMQIAAVIGLYGVNGLAILVYAAPVLLINKPKIRKFERSLGLSVGVGIVILSAGFGLWRLHGLPESEAIRQQAGTSVRVIQPSIAQQEKIDDANRFENFNRHLRLTQAPPLPGNRPPDLIVWPETSLPYILAYVDEARTALAGALQPHQLALIGTVRAEIGGNLAKPAYYNSLEILDAQGSILAHADKAHLVPFGEYLPWPHLFSLLGLHAAAEMTGGYSTAQNHVSLRLNETVTIVPLICYEVIFPTEMDYQGERANLLVNISNDAWYGTTPGPAQHFHQARLRAVEQGMPLIRGANNGISAVIDPYGRIIAKLDLNEVGFIDSTLPPAIHPIWTGGPGILQLFSLLAVFLLGIFGLKIQNRSSFLA